MELFSAPVKYIVLIFIFSFLILIAACFTRIWNPLVHKSSFASWWPVDSIPF